MKIKIPEQTKQALFTERDGVILGPSNSTLRAVSAIEFLGKQGVVNKPQNHLYDPYRQRLIYPNNPYLDLDRHYHPKPWGLPYPESPYPPIGERIEDILGRAKLNELLKAKVKNTMGFDKVEKETNATILYKVAPGYTKENITITAGPKGLIVIEGVKGGVTGDSNFKSTYTLAEDDLYLETEATLENGILAIAIPRKDVIGIKVAIR